MAIVGLIVLWPRAEEKAPEALTVVVPADKSLRLAIREGARPFLKAHEDVDLVLVAADDEKMHAYEAMWRKGESGVDLLIGAEEYLARWSREEMIEPWDTFLTQRNIRLSSASLDAGRVEDTQQMLPVALELSALRVFSQSAVAQPATLADLAALAAQLSASGEPALAADWTGQWAEATLLATALAASGTSQNVGMLTARAEDALAWWRRGIAEGWARAPGANESAPPLLWANQRTWFEERGEANAQLMLPPAAADNGTICVVYGVVLPKKAKRKDAARQFSEKVLVSEDFQIAMAQRTGLLPALVSAWPELKGAEWEALIGAAARSMPLPPELRARDTVLRFAQAATRCLNGELTPAAAAEEIAALASNAEAHE